MRCKNGSEGTASHALSQLSYSPTELCELQAVTDSEFNLALSPCQFEPGSVGSYFDIIVGSANAAFNGMP